MFETVRCWSKRRFLRFSTLILVPTLVLFLLNLLPCHSSNLSALSLRFSYNKQFAMPDSAEEFRRSRLVQSRPSKLPELSQQQAAVLVRSASQQTRSDPIYFYSSLVAGVGSGALASILCAPLDLVRVRMQVWGQVRHRTRLPITTILKEIRLKEGYAGYFRGLGATLLTVPAFWGVYFPLYDDFKSTWIEQYPTTNRALIHMGSAVLAGAISDVVCNPMFVVRTRLQTEALHQIAESTTGVVRQTSILQTVRTLYREGGVRAFWRGMTANLLGLSHVGVQFPVYEQLKKTLKHTKRHESAIDLILASSLSKITASLLTYPHEVIRSRMMDARVASGFVQTCRYIYTTEGMLGFYAGLPISLIRVIPNTCVTFLTYEFILRWARAEIRQKKEGRILGSI